jgi:hypothetical protein
MLCSNQSYYVVKFQGNPQSTRVLWNDYVGTKLAEHIGLPVPEAVVVHVPQELILRTSDLKFEWANGSAPIEPGAHFGSRFIVEPGKQCVFDWLPTSFLLKTNSQHLFAGAYAFDLWTCNTDRRQAVFLKESSASNYDVFFIDQGNCFDWARREKNLSHVCRFGNKAAYSGISMSAFEPWLSRIEAIRPTVVRNIASSIPKTWVDKDHARRSTETLLKRKPVVRDLVHRALNLGLLS